MSSLIIKINDNYNECYLHLKNNNKAASKKPVKLSSLTSAKFKQIDIYTSRSNVLTFFDVKSE